MVTDIYMAFTRLELHATRAYVLPGLQNGTWIFIGHDLEVMLTRDHFPILVQSYNCTFLGS